jgi:hypothetical protein
MLLTLVSALKTVATSPYAFVAYIVLICVRGYVIVAQSRLKRIAGVIKQVAPKDRARLLENEYRTFPRSGLSAEQWIRARRMNLFFLALVVLVLAATVLATVYILQLQETKRITDTSDTNWQMYLYMHGAVATDKSGNKIAEKLCDDESRAKPTINDPISLPRGETFQFAVVVELVIDNVFRTHQDLIYPVGLSTTWDQSVFTVYDGLDVQRTRANFGLKFDRELEKNITLTLPEKPGLQYIVIMSGAMMNAQQLFYATEDHRETRYSVWNVSYDNFARSVCTGFLRCTFSHLDGRLETCPSPS